jgi:hypothetical protein
MLLIRAVVTGFGLALGAAVFKKHVAKRLGLEEDKPEPPRESTETNPSLQHQQV